MFLYSTGFWLRRLPDWTPSRNSLVPSAFLTVPPRRGCRKGLDGPQLLAKLLFDLMNPKGILQVEPELLGSPEILCLYGIDGAIGEY